MAQWREGHREADASMLIKEEQRRNESYCSEREDNNEKNIGHNIHRPQHT